MNYILITRLLKYIDCFGTKFNFYTERSRKLYTAFGGLFTILSIIGGILYFICVEYDDFSHKEPISTISESKVNNTKIKIIHTFRRYIIIFFNFMWYVNFFDSESGRT